MNIVSHGFRHKVNPRLMGRIKLGQIFRLSEHEIESLISEVEADPLFQKLMYPLDYNRKVIRFQRFPQTNWLSRAVELQDNLTASSGAPDTSTLIENYPDIVALIHKIGEERFTRYFLYAEEDMGLLDIAAACSLTCDDARKIIDFVDKHYIQATCSQHPTSSTAGDPSLTHTAYTTVARIESGTGGPTITYISLFQARGRYEISYDRLENLKREGASGVGEIAKLERLIKKLELINERKNTLDKLLKLLAARQQAFFDTGDHSRLKPLSQRAAARQLGINQSIVSRLVFGRSILTPWHQELPLTNLFLSRKKWLKRILEDILVQGHRPRSDEALGRLLEEKTGVPVSRRSVANYRRELKVPSREGEAR